MSNIGYSEILFILVLAFIILGPEELVKTAKAIGLIFNKVNKWLTSIYNSVNTK